MRGFNAQRGVEGEYQGSASILCSRKIEPMNILQVISSIDPRGGGTVESIHQFGIFLTKMGHCVEVVCLDDPDAPWLASFPLKTYALGTGKTLYYYSPALMPWLKENAPRYDAVIVNGLWQYPGFAVWRALHGTTTPYFVYTHGMLDPWFKRAFKLKHFRKSLYWPWGEYRVLRDAKAVLFTCEEERLLAPQSFRLYRANGVIAPLGIEGAVGNAVVQKEAFLSHFPELRGKRLILFLGRIHVKKGCDLLIEAFAQVAADDPELHLVMAGPDEVGRQAELEARVSALGIAGRVSWPGMLLGDLKWGGFHASDVFSLPSHQENFGFAVAEALACSLPVLISNKVNIWREIQEDGAGLVANDTLEDTRHTLQQWVGMSTTAKQEMRQNALLCFRRRFEIAQAAANLLAKIGYSET